MNIIHKAQLELVCFLVRKLGWHVEIMIYEFSRVKTPTELSKNFKNLLDAYIQTKKLSQSANICYSYSCTYFNDEQKGRKLKLEFEKLMSFITLEQLTQIIVKNYPENVKREKLKKSLHEALRPIQIMAMTSYLRFNTKKQIVILAGKDEADQWKLIYNFNPDNRVGAILIPTLNLESSHNALHDNLTKNDILSVNDLMENWNKGNFLEWVLEIFVGLNEDQFEPHYFVPNLNKDAFRNIKNENNLKLLTTQVWNLIRKKND